MFDPVLALPLKTQQQLNPVLVTGAHGFIGSWLTGWLLDQGTGVVGLVRDGSAQEHRRQELTRESNGRYKTVECDLGDLSGLRHVIDEHSIDTVFHLAGQSLVGIGEVSPLTTFETNVQGTWNLLEACRLARCVERVVVASTVQVYGKSRGERFNEDSPLGAAGSYESSKAAADMIARSYGDSYGLPVAVARMSNVFGGGDTHFSRLIPDAVRALLAGEAPVLWTDGSPERDFLYVEDAVSAYLAIADALTDSRHHGRAFNVGSGRTISVRALIDRLIAVSGIDVEVDVQGAKVPEAGIDRQLFDCRRIETELGWSPRWTLDDALKNTWHWYAERPELLKAQAARSALSGFIT